MVYRHWVKKSTTPLLSIYIRIYTCESNHLKNKLIYIYTYLCIYIYIYKCIYICEYVYKYTCICTRIYIHMCILYNYILRCTTSCFLCRQTATHGNCITRQHTATHCEALQHCNVPLPAPRQCSRTAMYCHTLQDIAAHDDTLQQRQRTAMYRLLLLVSAVAVQNTSTLQHTATHCNTLQHTATHCNTLQHIAIHCSTLQHNAKLQCTSSCSSSVPLHHLSGCHLSAARL